jgi:Rab5 GDP/GTP exchange factor
MPSPRTSVEAVEDVDSLQNGLGLKGALAKDEDVNHECLGEMGTHVATQSSSCTENSSKRDNPYEELAQDNMGNNTFTEDTIEEASSHDSGVGGSDDPGSPMLRETKLFSADPMESSTATLRPGPYQRQIARETSEVRPLSISTNFPRSSSQTASEFQPVYMSSIASLPQYGVSLYSTERSPTRSDSGFDEKRLISEDEREVESGEEIQNIMDQFSGDGGGPGIEEVMSPRLELANPLLGNPVQHPPRKSSLEPLNPAINKAAQSIDDLRLSSPSPSSYQLRDVGNGPILPRKPGSIHSFSSPKKNDERFPGSETPMSPSGNTLHRPPPPEPEPEPDLPFDFHRFLEQLRHRTADPVAKFLRSFLFEFGKKQWMVHEQVKIISDFLAFIANKMAQCDVWREVSDAEFDNAREGMEKLVMNRLYTQTFSPAIPPVQPVPGSKLRRGNAERQMRPGRRGQHQEDVERDDILAQKIRIYGWIKEKHLDIAPVGESGRRFLVLAQQGFHLFNNFESITNIWFRTA